MGLVNMGNTCYMNASLQVLRRINEFKEGVIKYKGGGGMGDINSQFTSALQRLVGRLETKGDAFMPYEFFNVRKYFLYFWFLWVYMKLFLVFMVRWCVNVNIGFNDYIPTIRRNGSQRVI